MHCSTNAKQNATLPTPGRTSPCHCVTKPGITSAQHRSATPRPRFAPLHPAERYYANALHDVHHFATASLHPAMRHFAIASHTSLCLCSVKPYFALPLLHRTTQCLCSTSPALPQPLGAPRGFAYALLRCAMPMLCYAALCALCQYSASHRYTFAAPCET